jgi:hypothetical protein
LCCVDVGAWDGVHLSNTRQLMRQQKRHRWNGIFIEADDDKFRQLEKLYDNQYHQHDPSSNNTRDENDHNDNNDKNTKTTHNTNNKKDHTANNYDSNNNENKKHNNEENENYDQLVTDVAHHDDPVQQQIAVCIHATVSVDSDSKNSLTNLLLEHTKNNIDHIMSKMEATAVTVETANRSVERYVIDFLCIDIDGNDYWIVYDLVIR